MDLGAIVADFREHWLIYLSMPLMAAVIGYVTKVVAVEMMFRPLEFKGIRPFFGWQGVVPRNAPRMAAIGVDILLSRLISPQEIIAKVDPRELTRQVEKPLREAVDDLAREVLTRYQPGLWEMLPERVRRLVVWRIKHEAPKVLERMIQDMLVDIDRVLDLREMAVGALTRDKALLNRTIREVARNEMKFIIRSGLVFGFILGLVQMVTWALTHSAWIMPAFGGLTGLVTDWLALQMIFRPMEPRRFLGITFQGLFHKRRQQVSEDYGTLVAAEILTPANIVDAMLTGPQSDQLFEFVAREVQRVLDAQTSIAKPVVVLSVGGQRYQEMKQEIAENLLERAPKVAKEVEEYAIEMLDLRNTLVAKMKQMTTEEYENLLRPAFKQDEWKLISVGAVLGFLVGELQVLFLLH